MKEKIYFIPGTMCDSRLWVEVWQQLNSTTASQYQLIHLPIPMENSVEKIVSALYQVINDDLGNCHNESVYLVGFSLGGYLASAFCATFPEKVKKLFIAGNTPCELPEHELKTRKRIVEWVEKNGYSGLPNKRAADLLHHKNQSNKSIINKMIVMDNDLGQKVLLQQLKSATKRNELFYALAAMNIPMVFCFGIEDRLLNRAFFDLSFRDNLSMSYIFTPSLFY